MAGENETVVTPPADTTTTQQQATPWYGTVDAETLGYLQTKGWDKLDAGKAAPEIMKAHREAEKLIGVDPKDLIRVPKVGDVNEWNKVHEKLGMPAEAKAYDFSTIKQLSGEPLTPEQTTTLQNLAHELRLDPNRALLMVQKLSEISKGAADNASTVNAGENAKELDTLKASWAFKADTNKVVAENAAKALGLDPTILDTKGAPVVIPYSKAMEMFRDIGTKIGEDRFVQGEGNKSGAMTVEQAQYKLDMLGADKAWYEKFTNGDTVARAEFDNLTRLVHAGTQKR